jgi:hypothetical protein
MAFTLGVTTLPTPKNIVPSTMESSAKVESLTGRTFKGIRNIKKVWTLTWDYLAKADYDAIFAEYALMEVRTFAVTETNWTASYQVIIEISGEAIKPGQYKDFGLTIILTEES